MGWDTALLVHKRNFLLIRKTEGLITYDEETELEFLDKILTAEDIAAVEVESSGDVASCDNNS